MKTSEDRRVTRCEQRQNQFFQIQNDILNGERGLSDQNEGPDSVQERMRKRTEEEEGTAISGLDGGERKDGRRLERQFGLPQNICQLLLFAGLRTTFFSPFFFSQVGLNVL